MKFSAIFVVVSAVLVVLISDQAQAENYKVVCYFTNWSWYRKDKGKYTPEDIDPKLCTHIVYAFTTLDANTLTMKVFDSWADIDNKLYQKVTDFRNKGAKVTVALGGWNDSVGSKYGKLLTDAGARKKFIADAAEFIKKYNFQGLDLDLEYPACWQGACSSADSNQKVGFAQLVQELSNDFKPRGWLLSAAVSASSSIIDAAYDVPKLAQHLDWIGVMAYDFHGQWDRKTGINAPLHNYPGNSNNFYADYAIKHWIQRGAPSTKLVLGVPCYGQSFTLANAGDHGLNAPSNGGGQAGEFTRAAGMLSYYEICDNIKKGWTVVNSAEYGPYAFKDNQWVSYDDVETIGVKSKYIKDTKLAGGMIWSLDFDDFKGTCGAGNYPLLKALNTGLVMGSGSSTKVLISKMNYYVIPVLVSVILAVFVSDQAQAQNYKVVCYFTNWSFYRKGNGKFVPEDIDSNLCTHVVYSFAVLDENSLTIKIFDSKTDIDNHFYERVTDFRQKGITVMVAIGGWTDSTSKYGRLLTDANARKNFISNVEEFIEQHNFKGLDLDLEYPACWQGACSTGNPAEKDGFAQFVQELSEAFKPRGWLLSAAVSAGSSTIDAAYDVPKLAQHLDWINLMAYDFHSYSDQKTGSNAPLYDYPGNSNNMYVDYAVQYWIQLGTPSTKLILGAPCYGKSFTLANAQDNGMNAPTTDPGQAGQLTGAAGTLAYYEICDNIKNQGWTAVRNTSIGAYAFRDNQWVSFDDVETMRFKSKYVRDSNLGGAMIWALDLDDFKGTCGEGNYPLLSALNERLRN
ncbi:probable chitinase 10 [Sitodiplosis mosellana]|uniref:probable chitinase 10 n=1 Tax=Sitodiplosis mosellana TaxID=263140 RepID=UPI0024446DF6|nr:probable chitinase 10 [Sitodiplosis mosellana]